ncbi:MAG: tetratricopeptide repeat protein [Thiotrichales bacterium]|nr:tetratricopeptide repeat protein [Thiotrichales bacterium]
MLSKIAKGAMVSVVGLLFSGYVLAAEPLKVANYETSYALVLKYLEDKQDQQALLLLREMAKDYPNDTQVKNNLAVLLTRQKNYEQAQQIFEGLLKNNPEFGVVFDNLNELYAFQAQKAYKQVFGDSPLVLPKGQMLVLQKSPEALAELERLKNESSKRQAFNLIEQQVRQALENWRQAWSQQQFSKYVAAYETDFKLEGLESHAQWLKQRKRSVTGPSQIKVDLSQIELLIINEGLVSASFVQDYQSNRYKDRVKKVLYFKRQPDQTWKISQEMTVEVFE